MPVKRGIPVAGGYCIGRAYPLDSADMRVPKRLVPAGQIEHERQLAERAFESASGEISDQHQQFRERLGEEVADIFRGHLAILRDPKLRLQVLDLIADRHFSAAYAIQVALLRYQRRFEATPFMRDRMRDLQDVKQKLLQHLAGESHESVTELDEPVIIVAHDLTPSQTATLERTRKVLGFATDLGGSTSHTAIVARGLGIPAVVGLDDLTTMVAPGDLLILDGTHGVVIIDPDETQIAEYREQEARRSVLIQSLEVLRDLPAETLDGVRVELLGNIEFPEEVPLCLAKGAEGIGLFRTEFLFLRGGPQPAEEEQFQVYRQVAETLQRRPLVIRTLDLGADKYPHERAWEAEPNPFLGLRSIRYCLQHREVFWPQLRAILRACSHGNIRIMFPLISRVLEMRQAKYLLKLAMDELEEEGFEIPHDIPIGAMVETPSASVCAGELAREAAFLSIGTNDLVQYTLAVDRSNERVADLYTPFDPSVLRLMRWIIRHGKREKVAVSLCGEMAGDPMATILLVGMGLRCLSMSAGNIPEIKKIIRSIRFSDAHKVAQRVFGFETEREVISYLREQLRGVLPEAT